MRLSTLLLPEQLRVMAEEFGDRTAFGWSTAGSMTFAEWDGAANAMARRLVAPASSRAHRVGIHLRPSSALRWLVSYSAEHRAGAWRCR
jgi:non-ribosomal peptide synthetase component F